MFDVPVDWSLARGFRRAEVREQSASAHDRLLALLHAVPEQHLAGDTRFRRRLRLDTYGHYSIHAEAIRQWRRGLISR